MNTPCWLRLALLSSISVLSFAALAVASTFTQDVKGKDKPFPLSLFVEAKDEDFIGEKRCVPCHPVFADGFANSAHASYVRNPHLPKDRQGCEACHGPGKIHLEHRTGGPNEAIKYVATYAKLKPEQASAMCLRCHQSTLSESHWKKTGHARAGVGCTNCHRIHFPEPPENQIRPLAAALAEKPPTRNDIVKTEAKRLRPPIFAAAPEPRLLLRADEATLCGSCHGREVNEFRQNFHHPIPEGRMVCSDCHSVHPTRGEHKKVRAAKEFCVTCHAEVAGPFVFEHDPVAGNTGEGCMECHRPHGSHNPRLLTTFSRGVCAQCHTDKTVAHFPGRTCWQAGCHVGMHGSNTDAHLLAR